jgi:osmotically-inducible protein OsmY
MPDEKITDQVRTELERQGKASPRVDVTTVDGVVYLRGREPDAVRADGIVAVAHDIPGVTDVIDEIKREA